jgi:hypothetical protein
MGAGEAFLKRGGRKAFTIKAHEGNPCFARAGLATGVDNASGLTVRLNKFGSYSSFNRQLGFDKPPSLP